MSDVCGLCGLQRELKKSHFLSAGLFKAVSRGYAPYDPAPVLVNVKNETAVQSNFQSKKKFLCAECERRFDEGGEKNVIRNCFRDNGKFELREQLETRMPSLTNANRRVWFGNLLDEEFRAATFVYFAISIIWRASATEWPGDTGVEPGFLSRDLEEGCREFLLGSAPLPKSIDVLVHVNFDRPPTAFLSFPTREQVDLAGIPLMSYIFHIPGVRFVVLEGSGIAATRLPGLSAALGYPTFFEWHMNGTQMYERLVRKVASTSAKGKLRSKSGP